MAVDAKTFEIKLKEPFGLVLERSASRRRTCRSSCAKRVAETDPNKQITEASAPGPFIFVKDEWEPGDKAVYVKNPTTSRAPSRPPGFAGGKVAKVDRVEWIADSRPQHRGQRADQGRDRLIEVAADRSPAAAGKDPNIKRSSSTARHAVRLPPQPPAQAVRQSEDPPGALCAFNQEDFLRRPSAIRESTQGVQGAVRLRHAAGRPWAWADMLQSNFEKAKQLLKEAATTASRSC